MSRSLSRIDQSREFSSTHLVAELYSELRNLAAARIRQLPPGQTLQATALVHEAYLRLSREPSQRWDNRGHFFASAAEAMRRILVEQARRKAALRRSANAVHEPLENVNVSTPEPEDRILQVHEVLDELRSHDPALAEIVNLRFFAGLSHDEIAALLNISEKTARRQWNTAKIWLYERIAAQR